MSIDLHTERLELKDVARIAGVNLSTVWRWCLHGVRGHILGSFVIGGRRYVTTKALQLFVEAQNVTADGEPGDVQLSESAARRADEAERKAKTIIG